eukprot:c46303_g1_i1 orf=35-202(-)
MGASPSTWLTHLCPIQGLSYRGGVRVFASHAETQAYMVVGTFLFGVLSSNHVGVG